MKVWNRGGFRFALERGDLVVYADADKLADASEFDVPEIEVLRISKEDAVRELGNFWDDVKAEAKRLGKKLSKKKGKAK